MSRCAISTNLVGCGKMEKNCQVFERNTVLVRGEGLTGHEIDGEILLLQPESETFFGLDEVGASIWEFLRVPRTVDQLCSLLVEEYEVDFQTCRDDIIPFLEKLCESGLVKIALKEPRAKSD